MSEAKFTKGPWDGKTVIVRGLNFISHAHYRTDEGEANAHLIAAAPELYELLRQTEEMFDMHKGIDEDEYIYRQNVRAALAKARGETE